MLLLSIGRVSWGQEAYTVIESGTLPLRHYVGDQVTMRLRIAVAQGTSAPQAPQQLPEPALLDINDVRVSRLGDGEYEVIISFTSFAPGPTRLPALDLGPISLTDLRVDTRSILEERGVDRIEPARGQLPLPGTWRRLAALVISVVLLPTLTLWFGRSLLGAWARYVEARRRALPINRLMRVVRRLRRRGDQIDPRAFLGTLSKAVRVYLADRVALPAPSATSSELGVLLRGASLPQAESARLTEVLRWSDQVRFGSLDSTAIEREDALQVIADFAASCEEGLGVEP
jgi:hypothetical protein